MVRFQLGDSNGPKCIPVLLFTTIDLLTKPNHHVTNYGTRRSFRVNKKYKKCSNFTYSTLMLRN